VFNKQSYS